MLMYMRFHGGKRKALTFSYDDGVETDIRLMEIFNKNGLKGTFNLNGSQFNEEEREYAEGQISRPLARRRAVEAYNGEIGKNHEIALHCYTHPFLDRLPRDMQVYEVIKDREKLESTFGRIVKGCAYPMGTSSDTTAQVLDTCGVKYARTVEVTHNFAIPNNWLRMPSTCHHNDPKLFELADNFLYGDMNIWHQVWLFSVWGHSYEFDNDKNWDRIEKFCEKMGNRDDVWYATNVEIYDYIKAYEKLEFSAVGDIVHNPSSIPVWFHYAGVDVEVAPGETKKFR